MKNKNAVKIALDTLAQLDARKITATRGVYMSGVSINVGELQPQLKRARTCNVCAIGAMFASRVLIEDRFVVGDDGRYIGYGEMRKFLNDAFSYEELNFIELCFEGGVYIFEDRVERNLFTDVSAEDRMRLIMLEIIRNDGEFNRGKFTDHLAKVMKPLTAVEAALASYSEQRAPDAVIDSVAYRIRGDEETVVEGDLFYRTTAPHDYTVCYACAGSLVANHKKGDPTLVFLTKM